MSIFYIYDFLFFSYALFKTDGIFIYRQRLRNIEKFSLQNGKFMVYYIY